MTTDVGVGPASADTGVRRDPNTRALGGLVWRWTLLGAVMALAVARSASRIVSESIGGAESTHLLVVPACAVILAIGIARRRLPEVPIFDRQSDVIVGVVLLVVAAMLRLLVVPRYANFFTLVHPDVYAAYVLAMAACVFLFGLRRTAHFWPAWAVLLVASPAVVRLAAHLAGGGDTGFALVLVPLAALCVGAGAGTTRRRAAGLAVLSAIVGYLVLAAWLLALGREPGPLTQVLPVAAALAVSVPPLVRLRAAPGRRRPDQVVARIEALRYVPLLLVLAVAFVAAPLPQALAERVAVGPPGSTDRGLVVPADWREYSSSELAWAPRMFGPGATMRQQVIRSTQSRRDWDEKGRPRMALVFTTTARSTGIFGVYPVEMTFDTRRSRISPPTTIDLPRGVSARFRTVVDETSFLTWSLLSFLWSRDDGTTQRIMLLTIDNHDYDARFPSPQPGTVSTAARLASILFRGNASVTDEFSEQKDRGMLTSLGEDLVEAQWTA